MKGSFWFILGFLFPSLLLASGKSFMGQVPPELQPRKWINTQPLSWKKLRGKVVLLEFFSSG